MSEAFEYVKWTVTRHPGLLGLMIVFQEQHMSRPSTYVSIPARVLLDALRAMEVPLGDGELPDLRLQD